MAPDDPDELHDADRLPSYRWARRTWAAILRLLPTQRWETPEERDAREHRE